MKKLSFFFVVLLKLGLSFSGGLPLIPGIVMENIRTDDEIEDMPQLQQQMYVNLKVKKKESFFLLFIFSPFFHPLDSLEKDTFAFSLFLRGSRF